MPTPVRTARQCLTPEAAHALDEAVSVARRRGHGQTTSLHAVSALLSISSSPLREACARARNSTYSRRLQFKALDLCLSVSLDRGPSMTTNQQAAGGGDDEPPVSNSLMAAIRRSQANQRRQPENFHLFQQIQQNQSSVSCVKVEIQHLILSILDDPIVSRVFSESGFRSSDIKLAVLRPLPQVFKYSRTRIPPLFLCNLSENPDRSFSFPFSCYTGLVTGDENCRRIGEVLVRSKGRNPLLVGVNAYDALQKFSESLLRNKYNVLPVELTGLNIICIESEVLTFLINKCDEGSFNLKLQEVGEMVEYNFGPGLVVNIGDLKTLICCDCETYGDALNYVVSRLTKLLENHGRKLWLIGAVASCEMYLNFLGKFPSIEKDWDSQLLPITSMKPSCAEPYSRYSLMESFVPFAGFFSTPSEIKSPCSGSYECVSRCSECNDKCEQEVNALHKDISIASVVDQNQSNLPSWLQMAELAKHKGFDVEKAKDDEVLLGAKVKALQKKWDSECSRLHHPQLLPKATSCPVGSQFQTVMGFQSVKDSKKTADNCNSSNTYASTNGSVGKDLEIISTSKQRVQFPEVCKAKNESLMPKLFKKPSEVEHMSTDSITLVKTDLDLRIFSSSCSSRDFLRKIDPTNVKVLFESLTDKIGWQEEAISLISETIACCRTRNEKRSGSSSRGDIWLNFLGPDTFGKKKVATALAEVLFGGKEHFINIDFSSQIGMMDTNLYPVKRFRGKTAIDYIADELGKKKLSVIYLENVEKADLVAQNSLSHAIKTGKFADSHGREVSINNVIFVTTANFTDDSAKHFDDMIFKAKTRPIQISLKCDFAVMDGLSSPILVNKRKIMTGRNKNFECLKTSEISKRAHKSANLCLDLNNVPAVADETADQENTESEAWLEDFFNQVDKTVTFKPFDFDALEDKILKLIRESFHKIIGSDNMLDIDSKVVDQIVAAYCLSDNNNIVENWVELVLSRGFEEAKRKYNLTTHSALKLVASDGTFSDEQAPYLPQLIILN